MNRRILTYGKAASTAEVDKQLYLEVSFCCSCKNMNLSITQVCHVLSSKRYRVVNTCAVLFTFTVGLSVLSNPKETCPFCISLSVTSQSKCLLFHAFRKILYKSKLGRKC